MIEATKNGFHRNRQVTDMEWGDWLFESDRKADATGWREFWWVPVYAAIVIGCAVWVTAVLVGLGIV